MKKTLFIIAAIFLSSCGTRPNHETSEPDKEPEVIEVDYKQAVAVNLDTIIKDVEFVMLQSGAKDIGSFKKILIVDEHMIVWDGKRRCIWVHRPDGSLRSCIDKLGNGPEEYVDIDAMSVTNNGIINIIDSRKHRINKYDFDGRFIRHLTDDAYPIDYYEQGDMKYSFYSVINPDSKNRYHLQIHYGQSSEKGYFTYTAPWMFSYVTKYFIPFKDELSFHKDYDNRILQLCKLNMSVAYEANFGEVSYPYDFMEKNRSFRKLDKLRASSPVLVGNMQNICMSNNVLFFNYSIDKGNMYSENMLVYNKSTKEKYNINKLSSKELGLLFNQIIYAKDDWFYGVFEPYIMSSEILDRVNNKFGTQFTKVSGQALLKFKFKWQSE